MRDWIKFESSNVDYVCYESDMLYVKYRGGSCYRYTGVPLLVYQQLMLSESKGIFMNKEIKGIYNYELIKDGE